MLKKLSISLSIILLTTAFSASALTLSRRQQIRRNLPTAQQQVASKTQEQQQTKEGADETPETQEESETYAFPIRTVTSLEELGRILAARKPSIVVFNSPVCGACARMKPCLEEAAKKYDTVTFAVFNVTPEIKKNVLALLKKNNLPEYDSYPATYFIKDGKKPRFEGGAMESDEMDRIVHLFAHNKPRPNVMPSKQATKK